MSVYKYFPQESALRYLSTWALRITPPDQFNDPFEMRPRFSAMKFEHVREQTPGVLQEELVKVIVQQIAAHGWAENGELAIVLARCLMGTATADEEGHLFSRVDRTQVQDPEGTFAALRVWINEQLRKVLTQVEGEIPALNRMVESVLRTKLPELLGVLCLSGSGQSPLMWAHYAESHRGVMLEFDESDPTFNRRRSAEDDLGFLRRVSYSDTRPHINSYNGDEAFLQMALVKALHWAYEQEQRLIWPLSLADRHVPLENDSIYLLNVPPRALRGITFGCKAQDSFIQKIVTALSATGDAGHVKLFQASVADDTFALHYKRIG